MTKTSRTQIVIIILLFAIVIFGLLQYGEYLRTRTSLIQNIQTEKLTAEFKFVPPAIEARDDALDALLQAENDYEEMARANVTKLFIKDTLTIAKMYFIGKDVEILKRDINEREDGLKKEYLKSLLSLAESTPESDQRDLNYTEVLRQTQLISFKKTQAFAILDALSIFKEKEQSYKQQGLDTADAVASYEKAKTAFDEERYNEAAQTLLDADKKLDQVLSESKRTESLSILSRSFFSKFWPLIAGIIAAIIILAKPTFNSIRRRSALNKIKKLEIEIDAVTNLIKNAQKECFQKRTMTVDTYKVLESKYKIRIAEIKRQIPVLQAISRGEKPSKEEPKSKRDFVLQIEDEK